MGLWIGSRVGGIKFIKAEAPGGSHEGHHHYVPGVLVAAGRGRQGAAVGRAAANAELPEEEEDGKTRH